jgi:xylulokinase
VYLGIDIGTSSVKAVLVDDRDCLAGEASRPVPISRPRPLWSEQQPDDWWHAATAALDSLAAGEPRHMSSVRAIGLSGQMLGVTLLDAADRPIRAALLWNDGRAAAECATLHGLFPDLPEIVGCHAMPGFTAPKLLWLARHEPATLSQARRVLLPKDYVRLCLTGEAASDRADSSATLLMETRRGDWHDGIVAACGIDRDRLPRLVDSTEIAGTLRAALAARWRLPQGTPVMGGAGDNMCAGVGVGAVRSGDAYIGLGTSGVYFVANDTFMPARGGGMHTHRHAVTALYCQHAVVLSAAGALAWIADVLKVADIGKLMADVDAARLSPADTPVFTPYLAGERTPHDDPHLTATFSGLTHATGGLHLVQAVMEGVALALADGHEALAADGASVRRLTLTGGGARSRLWARLIATALDVPLAVSSAAREGPALGAARLARVATGGPLLATEDGGVPPVTVAPEPGLRSPLLDKRAAFRAHLRLRQTPG